MSIRTVRTDGIGCFQSVHDRKIASVRYTVRKMHLIKRLKRKNISIQECCHNKRRARYTYIHRSLSVSDNMTRLKRKKIAIKGYCHNKRRARYACRARSLSVSDNMTRLSERKYQSRDTATTKGEPDMHIYIVLLA